MRLERQGCIQRAQDLGMTVHSQLTNLTSCIILLRSSGNLIVDNKRNKVPQVKAHTLVDHLARYRSISILYTHQI